MHLLAWMSHLLSTKPIVNLNNPYSSNDVWDYDNPQQIHNKIKVELEEIDLATLSESERDWCREILWFWHHHAISCAYWKQDRDAACFHSAKALGYQEPGHPNKITKLLFFLIRDEIAQARLWAETIDDEVESLTAQNLLAWYERGELSIGSPR